MDRTEIRELLLLASAGLITKVMDSVDQAQLDSATLRESIDVEDAKWNLVVTYNRRAKYVDIQGAPLSMNHAELVAQLFGSSDGFRFIVPAAWVPAEVDARDRLR